MSKWSEDFIKENKNSTKVVLEKCKDTKKYKKVLANFKKKIRKECEVIGKW